MTNNTLCSLADKQCKSCAGEGQALPRSEIMSYMEQIHPQWELYDDTQITRQLEFKGYAKAISFANAVGWIANQQGHHPDICFGWGYCKVTFTTHELQGLSENDFICAAQVDALIAG